MTRTLSIQGQNQSELFALHIRSPTIGRLATKNEKLPAPISGSTAPSLTTQKPSFASGLDARAAELQRQTGISPFAPTFAPSLQS
jgi:hypothetical protein